MGPCGGALGVSGVPFWFVTTDAPSLPAGASDGAPSLTAWGGGDEGGGGSGGVDCCCGRNVGAGVMGVTSLLMFWEGGSLGGGGQGGAFGFETLSAKVSAADGVCGVGSTAGPGGGTTTRTSSESESDSPSGEIGLATTPS